METVRDGLSSAHQASEPETRFVRWGLAAGDSIRSDCMAVVMKIAAEGGPGGCVKSLITDGVEHHQMNILKLIPNIPVADVERSVEFYRQILGFDLIAVRGRGDATRAHLKLGDVEIIFRSLDVYAPLPYLDPALENQLILHIQVDDVVDLFNRVKDKVRIVRSLEPTLFGSAEFMIRDIDGRVIAFSQPAGAAAHARADAGPGRRLGEE